MKTTTITTLAFAAIAFVFAGTASCKKAKTKTELLTEKGWRLTAAQTKENSDPWVDEFTSLTPCEKDDILSFLANNSTSTDQGALKCNAADPQTEVDGTWSLNNSDADLLVNQGSFPITYKIITLDANTLKLSGSITGGGSTLLIESTFAH